MRLRLLASLVGTLALAGQLGNPSRSSAQTSPVCAADAATQLCEFASAPSPVEPEAVAACSEASSAPSAPLVLAGSPIPDFTPAPPLVKQTEEWDSSAWVRAWELGGPKSPKLREEVQVAAAQAIAEAPAPEPVQGRRYQVDDNHDVRRFLDQFQTGYRRAVVERWLVRAGRYLPMVLDVFRQKGLPEELVFTAMIESGFDPLAVSKAGARGIWQFMAPTAKRYGLRIDRWLDERLDPEKSTVAAARHFVDLYSVFGSWNLAQAAYNAGERTVTEAIRSMGTSDFWALTRGPRLADETKNFVPAIQAATIIAKEPERYGFVVTPAPPLEYELVAVPRSTSLKLLAAHAGIDGDTLERLNPELRLKQTPPDVTYSLKVPIGSASRIQAALEHDAAKSRTAGAAPQAPAVSLTANPHFHLVKAGETVAAIAKRYGIPASAIVRWNDLGETARIRPGARLRVAGIELSQEAQDRSK
jgi:soluble lytic murein transglycosylase-like protein